MVKFIWVIISIVLILLIFLRTPQNQGLVSFSTKSNLLGSPSSAEQVLNNLTVVLMVLYFLFALYFNLINSSQLLN
jgi:protein translocase SecG subunit